GGDLEPDHPRGGGEDRPGASCGWWCTGTPPRRRGGLDRRHHELGARRNTPASAGRTFEMLTLGLSMTEHPASAGRTPSPRTGSRPASEHPRVGGEDACSGSVMACRGGTPPRRRGGPRQLGRPSCLRRNTPASAGRTTPHVAPPARSSEHPRVGGEDVRRRYTMSPEIGTPPRRRGGPQLEGRLDRGVRNTPASAGRTSRTLSAPRRPAEHPRVGGEDETTYQASRGGYGTPPRRRGGPRHPHRAHLQRRNTPASAGRTRRGRG